MRSISDLAVCVAGCGAVLLIAEPSLGQEILLKNDRCDIGGTCPTVGGFNASVQLGFIYDEVNSVGEIGASSFDTRGLNFPIRILKVQIFWPGPDQLNGVTPTNNTQAGIHVYSGQPKNLAFPAVAVTPVGGIGFLQMTPGGMNEFDITNSNIVIQQRTDWITVGMEFFQAPALWVGLPPLACSLQLPNSASLTTDVVGCGVGLNWVKAIRIDPVAGCDQGWLDPCAKYPGQFRGNWIIRAVIEELGQSCYADCDQSTGAGILDIFDFLCFQNSFVAGEPYACECDTSTGSGVCDIFDFLCFQNAFVAGCP